MYFSVYKLLQFGFMIQILDRQEVQTYDKGLEIKSQRNAFYRKYKVGIFYFINSAIVKSINEMQSKYRSFPPAFPLKMNKLLEYEYFSDIYKKYDCNFFREILPYFSQITTTDRLETLKFIYVPIQNPNKVPKIQIGVPFVPQVDNRNPNYFQLRNEVTFIKITFQTHIIFEYLMNLNLFNVPIQKLKFQDKFWLFSEGILKSYSFNDVVFRNDSAKQSNPGVYFILDGEFKCFNSLKRPYKTVGKGYFVDSNKKLKKVLFQNSSTLMNFYQSSTLPTQKQLSLQKAQQFGEDSEVLHSLVSNSNNSKILYLDMAIIRKYTVEDPAQCLIPSIKQKSIVQPAQIKPFLKYRRLKTQKQEPSGSLVVYQNGKMLRESIKKFNLISCRQSGCHNLQIKIPIEQISQNQVLKSYTKDNELYKKMKKEMSERKHRRFFSNEEKEHLKAQTKNFQLLPFFRQQLKDEKEKASVKRRKTKQLWGLGLQNKENLTSHFRPQPAQQQRNSSKWKPLNQQQEPPKKLMKKISKTQIGAFQLIKRNLFNKQYHKVDFVQIHI